MKTLPQDWYTNIEEIITIPHTPMSYEAFCDITRFNIEKVFGLKDEDKAVADKKQYGMEMFLENADHGAEHIFHVYTKANEIADIVKHKTGQRIDPAMLYVMIALHDAGRFHMEKPEATDSDADKIRKDAKAKKADSRHELYGVAQFKFALAKLKKAWISMDPIKEQKIAEYIYNHDFMNAQLNGGKYHEPSSLEWQISRLADRISTPAIPEIERYWATGKRMGTPFFNKDVSFEERKKFTFQHIGQYAKQGKLDEFMFFATLLAVKPEDFSHPVLQEIYREWEPQKKEAAERILTMAQEEGFDEATIDEMRQTLKQYAEIYEFDFE